MAKAIVNNKIVHMNRVYKISVLLLLIFLSCTKKLENPGATQTLAMSNEWWVTLQSGGIDLLGTHVLFATYNTSQNVSDSLWLDDLRNGYQFKCKVLANPKTLTFLTTDSAQNEYYDIRVHITNGKIIPNAGTSKSTHSVVDSIYMEATFSDDMINTYIISGVARSRWAQDDY